MLEQFINRFRILSTKQSQKRKCQRNFGYSRKLRHEPLEDRRMLAILTVNVLNDDTAPGGLPLFDNGELTLRDAIAYVNGTTLPGPNDRANNLINETVDPLGTNDTIVFSTDPEDALDGETIELDAAIGNLHLINPVTIAVDQSMLPNGITIDGNGAHSAGVFWVDPGLFVPAPNNPDISYEIRGLTITGNTQGEGIFIFYLGDQVFDTTVTIANVVVENNHGNGTSGDRINAGGITAQMFDANNTLRIVDSIIQNNSSLSDAGGISIDADIGGTVEIHNTIVTRNYTTNSASGAWGINLRGTSDESVGRDHFGEEAPSIEIVNSTISDNRPFDAQGVPIVLPVGEGGGGIRLHGIGGFQGPNAAELSDRYFGTFRMENTTVTNNISGSNGGGLYMNMALPLHSVLEQEQQAIILTSTITGNETNGEAPRSGVFQGDGGGIWASGMFVLRDSLVADNTSYG